ncbi:hypothetical protein TSTA_008660 [Talaromyces stipitatus ATCC 10500]|uniref:Uncharacterized protein n=1 Tax=Talaromyces stipitatus (strain ATCC 10500 / CBS 375.48 / QM 6759 / NRRL 1006) TaxID=441959 RepID=B8MVB4_TALSN|nr:uncharacterized protein TSTA_008660 [Talaromyces stipitatus ATCC 10500]EED11570.1 hypothetical protein TSTA_008660 [Talaromyces stipitatus ATCC 10500]
MTGGEGDQNDGQQGSSRQTDRNGQTGQQGHVTNTGVVNHPTVIDQATEIPKDGQSITLTPIQVLQGADDYNRWYQAVRRELLGNDLLDLIDKSIPRPHVGSAHYKIWKKLSLKVAGWLSATLSRDVGTKVQTITVNVDYADDLLAAIRTICKGEADSQAGWRAWTDFRKCDRHQYATCEAYIHALRAKHSDAERDGFGVQPCQLIITLLHSIETDLPTWVTLKMEQYKDVKSKNMDDFHQLCSEALEKCQGLKFSMGNAANNFNPSTPATPKSTDGREDKKRKERDPDTPNEKKRNAPKPGVSVEEWLKKLRKWRSRDDNCGYCGIKGHGCSKCYYLADSPPPNWYPKLDLWCYRDRAAPKQQETKNDGDTATKTSTTMNVSSFALSSDFFMPNIGGAAIDTEAFAEHVEQPIDKENMPKSKALAMALSATTPESLIGKFVADSGAGHSMAGDFASWVEIYKYKDDDEAYTYECSNGMEAKATGYGTTLIRFDNGEDRPAELLTRTYYVPGLKYNLWACERAKDESKVWYCSKDCTVRRMDDDSVIGHTTVVGGVPILRTMTTGKELQFGALNLSAISAELQHRRLGHASDVIRKGTAQAYDLEAIKEKIKHCESCRLGKSKRIVSHDPLPKALKAGQIVYVDVQHIKPTGFNGYNYFTAFLDDKTLHDYCTEFKNQTGNWPVIITKDQGREFFRFIKWSKENQTGIQFRESPARTPEPNGPIEWLQFYLAQIARVMMIDAGLPEYLWPFAVETACYTVARLVKPGQEKAPIQQWREELGFPNPIPHLEHLRVWGCKAYMHIPEEDRVKARKMLPKTEIGRLMGYMGDHGHIYKIWFPATGDVKFSRDVTFWEGPEDGMIDEIEDPTPTTTKVEMSKPLTIIFHKDPVEKNQKRITIADENLTIEDILNSNYYDFEQNAYVTGRAETLSTTPERTHEQDRADESDQEEFFDAEAEGSVDATTEEALEIIRKKISQQKALIKEQAQIMNNEQALVDGITSLETVYESVEHNDTNDSMHEEAPARMDDDTPVQEMTHKNITTRVSSRKNKGMRLMLTLMEEQEREQEQRRAKKEQKASSTHSTSETMVRLNINTNLQASAIPDIIPKLKKWEVEIPGNDRQMLKSPLRDLWKKAMQDQVEKLRANETWKLVPKPKNSAKILPGKWVYDVKADDESNVTEFRARWVVCGNFEVKDNENNYSPVVSDVGVKIFLTYCIKNGLKIFQADIITAYLHAMLQRRQVLVEQLKGVDIIDGMVCSLLKALYGLRGSAVLWYDTISSKLKELGYKPINEEPCIFIRESDGMAIALYVDDNLIAGKCEAQIDGILDTFDKAWGVKRIGEPKRFLGINVHREKDTIKLEQSDYVDGILNRFSMADSHPRSLPLEPKFTLESNDPKATDDEKEKFVKITGSANWLTSKTRPDITFTVRRLQHKQHDPTKYDYVAGKGVLRYLKGTKKYGITLNKYPSKGLEVYVDSSHADHPNGKSTEGFIIFYAGSPISWNSSKQTLVAPSSTVSEYLGVGSGIRQGLWIQNMLISLGLVKKGEPLVVYTDSNNAMTASHKPGTAQAVRWLRIHYHFMKDLIDKGEVILKRIDTKENPADGLTKALTTELFDKFRNQIGVEAC